MQKVFVRDFERAELGPFAAHLADLDECDPEAILDAVYAQTSGHPAMTQQLCRALEVEGLRDEPADVRVARVVEDEFFQPGNRDHLMRDVDGRFAKPDIARVGKMLSRYQVLLIEGGARLAAPDEEADAVLDGLRVAGLVTLTSDGRVRVRNRIFARAFDRAWVEQRLSARWPFAPEMSRWLQQRSKSLLLNGERLDEVIGGALRIPSSRPRRRPSSTPRSGRASGGGGAGSRRSWRSRSSPAGWRSGRASCTRAARRRHAPSAPRRRCASARSQSGSGRSESRSAARRPSGSCG